jgi:hypothetical protein
LSIVLHGAGKTEEAKELIRRALASCQKVVEECPGVPEYRRQLAGHWIHLEAELENKEFWTKSSVHASRQALSLLEGLVAESPRQLPLPP